MGNPNMAGMTVNCLYCETSFTWRGYSRLLCGVCLINGLLPLARRRAIACIANADPPMTPRPQGSSSNTAPALVLG